MDCSKLTAGLVAAKCNETAAAGLEDDVVLINYDDIDKSGSTITDNVIETIELKTGKKGFSFSSYGISYNGSGCTFTKGTYRNTWLHDLFLRIFTKSEVSKTFVNEFGSGSRVIAIVKNKENGTNGEVKYEVFGWDNGLSLKESANVVEMTDGVVYTLHIGSEETAQEGSIPKSFFDTDLETTEQKVASLTA